jgi:hypothetical protein
MDNRIGNHYGVRLMAAFVIELAIELVVVLVIVLVVGLIIALSIAPFLRLSAQSAPQKSALPAGVQHPFDPHDLDGVWLGEQKRPGNGRFDNHTPEPPLTDWAKEHVLYKSISHDSMAGTLIDPKRAPDPKVIYSGQRRFYSQDLYGVPVNVVDGEYPGKDCEPLSTPATFDYTFGPMELLSTREGDRIFQFFEYHREWRTWWLNRDHPKDLDASYEGDSTARWDGDTLVVDTIGYNDKTMITGVVAHRKSDAFHLVERYRRVDHDHLEISMTYYDPKAWGDKPWPGFHRYYKLVPTEQFEEFICSPREYQAYDRRVTNRTNEVPGK